MGTTDAEGGDPTIAVGSGPTPTGMPRRPAEPPLALGRYIPIEEIGRGGMGVVLRAYDSKLQREVALKVLRTEALSVEARARMVREARAMARLSHPNVVELYDVDLESSSTGGVMLAMEYVEGMTLRQWQRELGRPPPWGELLDMFIQAGRGLAAANASGLLHRDFKPANVLVGRDGRVRVTDFGLARVEGGGESESGPEHRSGFESSLDELTEAGSVMGTPAYMAPEQHQGRDLTSAVDQYAFCLSLWEGLTGSKPFEQRELLGAKLAGPPPWPRDAHVPKAISNAVCRGLAPDPEQRWPSMDVLLQVLEAGQKRRRRGWLLAAGAIAAGGLAMTWTGAQDTPEACAGAAEHLEDAWDDARREAARRAILDTGLPYATDAWTHAQTRLDDYARAWGAMHTETCEATTIRGEQPERIMDLRMACLRRARLNLAAVGDVLGRADAKVVERAHRIVRGLPRLERCADIEALTAELAPPDPSLADAVLEQRSALALAKALRSAGKYPEVVTILEDALAESRSIGYENLVTDVLVELGHVYMNQGTYEEAQRTLEEALRRGLSHGHWREAAAAIFDIVYLLGSRLSRPREAMAFAVTARGLLPHVHDRAAASLRNSLGTVLMSQGRYKQAEAQMRAALEVIQRAEGIDESDALTAHLNLAVVLSYQRRNAEAATEYRSVLDGWSRTLGPQHPDVAATRHNLALVLAAAGDHEEAEREYLAALEVWEKTLGPDHANMAQLHSNLGVTYMQMGRYEQAELHMRAALPIQERALGPDHPYNAAVRGNLALVLRHLDRLQEAETQCRTALALQEKLLGSDHPDIAASHQNLASILSEQGKLADAEHEFRTSLAMQHKALGPDHPHVAMARISLAQVLLERGRPEESIPLVREARRSKRYGDVTLESRADAAFVLADALWQTGGDRAEARQLAESARDHYAELAATGEDEHAQAESWLRTHR